MFLLRVTVFFVQGKNCPCVDLVILGDLARLVLPSGRLVSVISSPGLALENTA